MKKLSYLLFLGIVVASCNNNSPKTQNNATAICVSTDTSYSTSCAFITSDKNKNSVLSWVKQINDSTDVMCYAISSDNGKTLGKTVEIPTSKNVQPHGESLPKMIFKPNGEIIAIWGVSNANAKNKYAKLIYYAQSFDAGITWSNATLLVKDTNSSSQSFFDVALLSNGEAGILWLDNRKKEDTEGSTVYYASTNGIKGFQNELIVAKTICQCCRTDLFVDSKGTIHTAFRDIINDSIRDMVHTVSVNGGKTFSAPQRISADNWVINGCPHTGPTQTENKNGLHFAWYSMGGGEGVFYCNTKNGNTFSSRNNVSKNAGAKHPQITTLENDKLIIVWDETIKKGETINSLINIQLRNAEGEITNTWPITTDNNVCEFPVLKAINNNTVLVAYTMLKNKKKQVYYKTINIPK